MTLKLVARDRVIPLQFSGLLPLTKHYLYIDTERVSSGSVKPYGGLLGEQLITDASGRLVFDYYHVTGSFDVSNRDQASTVNRSRVSKRRRFVVCNVFQSTLDEDAENAARSSASVFF